MPERLEDNYTLKPDWSFAGGIPSPPYTLDADMERRLDPKYVAFFKSNLSKNAKIVYTHRFPIQEHREVLYTVPGQSDLDPMSQIFDSMIPRRQTEGPDIPIRVFIPHGQPPESGWPLFIWFHGGGWTLGNITTENSYCTKVASLAKCVVISIDYRLAPEDPYPAYVNDCYESVLWGLGPASKTLGTNVNKVAVGGSSAGGNLTGVVTHKLVNDPVAKSLPPLVFQLQVVPVTDNTATPETMVSWKVNANAPQLNDEKMLWYRRCYLQNDENAEPEASPLFYPDESFAKVPPCFIAAAECDVLCSEAEAYAAKLKKNGVPTELVVYKGVPHVVMVMDGILSQGKQLIQDTTDAVRNAFYNN